MNCLRIVLVAALIAVGGGAVAARPAIDVSPEQQEQLRREYLEEYARWRQGIPDYDRRLYDRVRASNDRALSNLRVSVIGTVLILLAIGGATILILRSRPRSVVHEAAPRGASTSAAGLSDLGTGDPALLRRLEQVHASQRHFRKILGEIEVSLHALTEEISEFHGERTRLDALVSDGRRLLDRLDHDLSAMTAEDPRT